MGTRETKINQEETKINRGETVIRKHINFSAETWRDLEVYLRDHYGSIRGLSITVEYAVRQFIKNN